jgi:EAL domain-containing protein (putative c-di-GMP-specific phosphodiesterase class I)
VENLPVDDLKIHKSFIDGLGEDPVNDAIVTAEGVENGQQVDSLTIMRCDLAQGFYFSKPLGGEAAGKFIATNPAWGVSK